MADTQQPNPDQPELTVTTDPVSAGANENTIAEPAVETMPSLERHR